MDIARIQFAGRCLALALLGVVMLPCIVAAAEEDSTGVPDDQVEQAKSMIFEGQPDQALEIFRELTKQFPDDPDVHFFRGLAALESSKIQPRFQGVIDIQLVRNQLLDEAVDSFRLMLELEPDSAAGRLELARALFERGDCHEPPQDFWQHLLGDDCDAAEYHYRRALAGEIPQELILPIHQVLNIIRGRKRFTGYFSFAVVPNSNIVARPATLRFLAFPNLDFIPSEDQAPQTGTGLLLSVSGNYQIPVSRMFRNSATRIRLGGSLFRREYAGHQYDDMGIAIHVGPRFLFETSDATFYVKHITNWFGGNRINDKNGLGIDGNVRLNDRVRLSHKLEYLKTRERNNREADSNSLELLLELNYFVNPAVLLNTYAVYRATRATANYFSNDRRQYGIGATFELAPILNLRGFQLSLNYSYGNTQYKAFNPSYGAFTRDARKDRLRVSQISLSNSELNWRGFAPRISYTAERQHSNTSVESYNRNLYELSLRRIF